MSPVSGSGGLRSLVVTFAMLGAAAGVPAAALAQQGELSLRAGIEHTTGDYGGVVEVSDVYVPVTLLYETQRTAFRLTVPYLEVEFADPVSANGLPTDTVSGLGDVIVGATVYDVLRSADGSLVLDLTGKIKLPTADEERGLGTGEADFTLQTEIYKFLGRVTLAGSVGYRLRGEPSGYPLDDTWQLSAGSFYRFSDWTSGGVFLDYRQSSIPGAPSIREATVYLSRRIGGGWRAQGYLIGGLSDTALDWGAGFAMRRDF